VSDLRWYVIRTEPRAEYLAANELERDGFEIFFPRLKTPEPRRAHYDTPLFPGYMFIRCDPDDEGWPSFRPAHRVSGWVRLGGEVPSVPDEVVTNLVQRLESVNSGTGFWRRYRAGEKVNVVSRSIQGLAEVVEEPKSPRARVTVLIEFMGRLVQAKIPWQNLRPLEEGYQEGYQAIQRAPRRTRGRSRWIRGFGARAEAGA